MTEYHKINSIFKREPDNPRRLIIGDWAQPEFEYLAECPWEFTEKVDGTNIRVTVAPDGTVTYGGRTDAAQIPTKLLQRLRERFEDKPEALRQQFPDGAVLYGEGYGPGIQKGGGNYRQDQDFVLFDVRVGNWWLQRADVEDVARALGLDVVPVIGEGTLHDAVRLAQAGIQSTYGAFQAEGIVARPKVELKTRSGHRIIAKIKCRDFK